MVNARADAFAPASMGNVGVAFDIMGLAFREPGDIVRVEPRDIELVVAVVGECPSDQDAARGIDGHRRAGRC